VKCYVTRYEWYDRASRFSRSYRDVAMAVDKLVNIPNRELLYDVYAYITDMRSTLALVNSYVKWLGICRSFVDQSKLSPRGWRDDMPPADGSSIQQRIYVRPRTGPQSAHLWWPASCRQPACYSPGWDRLTDRVIA